MFTFSKTSSGKINGFFQQKESQILKPNLINPSNWYQMCWFGVPSESQLGWENIKRFRSNKVNVVSWSVVSCFCLKETQLLSLWCLKECLLCIPDRLMRHRGMGLTGRKEVWVGRSLVSWVRNVWRKLVMPGKMGGVRVLTRVANDHLVGHCVGP